ncbi:hypothetical protein [Myroides guanonis]|uniref:TolB-like 6-blade propeller-like n=1 Tax=Myroides guanonis TaxID=1150112 RepID=A0A1I3PEW3_9FLAO|nr:hypothetical protein [Myroides guanonis]SFJ20085.1 hypothetical protein SAMN04487893_10499 [Myroides guanonis]
MIKNLVISFSTVFLFFSCVEENKNTVEFNIGFNTELIDRGVFFNKETNKEEVYFLKPRHNQIIKFFDGSGILLDSTVLKVDSNEDINNLKVFSRDSILLTLGSENTINLIDRHGEVTKTEYLKKKMNLKDNYIFFPFKNNTINYPNINDLLFSIYYQANDSIIEANNGSFDFFYENQNRSFHALHLKNAFKSNQELKLGLKGFHENIKDTIVLASPFDYSSLSIQNGHIFYTIHDNYISILNKDLELAKKIKIIDEKDLKTYIQSIMYNKTSNSYYFILVQNEGAKNVNLPASLLKIRELDHNFSFKKERAFDTEKYDANNILLINDKIYLGSTENRIYGKTRYEILDTL